MQQFKANEPVMNCESLYAFTRADTQPPASGMMNFPMQSKEGQKPPKFHQSE